MVHVPNSMDSPDNTTDAGSRSNHQLCAHEAVTEMMKDTHLEEKIELFNSEDETPSELWSKIVNLLPTRDQIRVMKVSRRFHDIGAYHVYRVLYLAGHVGFACCAMFDTDTPTARGYMRLVRNLGFYAVHEFDYEVTFPMLSRLMKNLVNIHTLKLYVPPIMGSTYLGLLQKHAIIRRQGTSRVLSLLSLDEVPFDIGDAGSALMADEDHRRIPLPLLQHISLMGPSSLTPVAMFRPIVEFEINEHLTNDGLAGLLHSFDTPYGRQYLKRLRIRLHIHVDVVVAVSTIGEVVPGLRLLTVEQSNLHVQNLLKRFATHDMLPSLRVLNLNPYDPRPTYWVMGGPQSQRGKLLPLLNRAFANRAAFEWISFGVVVHKLCHSIWEQSIYPGRRGTILSPRPKADVQFNPPNGVYATGARLRLLN